MQQKKKFLVSFLTVLTLIFISVQTTYAYSGTVLENEMRGDQVLNLQKDLKKLGFFKEDPTGYFGDVTKEAVISFQKKYDLKQDGLAGTQTLNRIDKLMGRPVNTSRGNSVSTTIVGYAKKFLGVDYVWGGTSPKGFDCSGFVKYVFKKFGITLDRVSSEQAGQGSKIKKANLLPGDLVFFDTNGGHNRINHVGMYIGSGRFIQASSESSGVVISSLSDGFYAESYMTARRLL